MVNYQGLKRKYNFYPIHLILVPNTMENTEFKHGDYRGKIGINKVLKWVMLEWVILECVGVRKTELE